MNSTLEQVKNLKIFAQCAISGTKPVAVAVAGRQNVVVKLLHYTNLTVCSGQMLPKNAYVRHISFKIYLNSNEIGTI